MRDSWVFFHFYRKYRFFCVFMVDCIDQKLLLQIPLFLKTGIWRSNFYYIGDIS